MAEEYYGDLIGCVVQDGKQIALNFKGCRYRITKDRSVGHHRLCFKIISETVKRMKYVEFIHNSKDPCRRFLEVFKDYKGMYDVYTKPNGEQIRSYHSIAFDSMDQLEFQPLANDLFTFCIAVLRKDKAPEHSVNEVIALMEEEKRNLHNKQKEEK
jgi:hypothetical protein